MGKDQNEAWVAYLNGGMVGKDIPGVGLLYGVTLKIEIASVLAILKVKGAEGYVVSFVGARDVEGVVRKIRPVLTGETGVWKEDKYT